MLFEVSTNDEAGDADNKISSPHFAYNSLALNVRDESKLFKNVIIRFLKPNHPFYILREGLLCGIIYKLKHALFFWGRGLTMMRDYLERIRRDYIIWN